MKQYKPIIDKLKKTYDGNNIITEYEDVPVTLINEYIHTIEVIEKSESNPSPNYDLALRTFIKRLKCFKWRFVSSSNAGDVWNPLSETFTAFVERTNEKFDHWYDDKPFPSEEIIENWVKSNVRSNNKTVHRKKSRTS